MTHGDHDPAAGSVILSILGAGTSRICSDSPSVRFVLRGEAVHTIQGRSRRVRAGEFLLVRGHVQSVVRTPAGFAGMCIYLPGESRPFALDALDAPVIAGTALDPFARDLQEQAAALECGEARPVCELVALGAAGAAQFIWRVSRTVRRLPQVRPAARIETLQRLERVRALLHAQSGQALSLDELAREASLSRFHLIRTFSKAFGTSPIAYHRRLRLDSAARRLEHRETTPTRLADELGYTSLSSFTRAFRSRFGMPPSEWHSSNSG